jgi:hypothetical protein
MQPRVNLGTFIAQLHEPEIDFVSVAKEAEEEPARLESLIGAVGAEDACTRFAASKLLRIISHEKPELMYPHVDFLAGLLHSKNSFLKWNAMIALADLAVVDKDKKLDGILDVYLKPIRGAAMVDAANAIRGAAVIAKAKPYLADRIARKIVQVEQAHYAKAECRNVAIGHAILGLGQFFGDIHCKKLVREFVERQKRNTRPATRRKAEMFCRKWLRPH